MANRCSDIKKSDSKRKASNLFRVETVHQIILIPALSWSHSVKRRSFQDKGCTVPTPTCRGMQRHHLVKRNCDEPIQERSLTPIPQQHNTTFAKNYKMMDEIGYHRRLFFFFKRDKSKIWIEGTNLTFWLAHSIFTRCIVFNSQTVTYYSVICCFPGNTTKNRCVHLPLSNL